MAFPVACYPKSSRPGNGGGEAVWSPLALTSTLIWCDMTLMTFSNGDPVDQFTNWVPGGPHFAELTQANKPTYLASGINGLPSLRGDGVDDNLNLTGLGAQSAWSAAIVFRQHTVDTGANTLWSIASYPSAGNYKMFEKGSGADGSASFFVEGNPGTSLVGVPYTSGDALVIIVTANGSGCTWADSTGHTDTGAGNHARADDLMQLFRRGDGNFMPADIGELIFTGAVMTAEEIATVFEYFGTKWGTAIP